MKKIAAVIISILFPMSAFAADISTSTPPVISENGNPENVVSIWGFTNAQLPHLKPGQSVTDKWGGVSVCPIFFLQLQTYCVDISKTAYYMNR